MEKIMMKLGFSGLPQMIGVVNEIIKQGGTLVFNQHGFLCYQLTDKEVLIHFGLGYEGSLDYWKEKLKQLGSTFNRPVRVLTDRKGMLRAFDLKTIASFTGKGSFYIGEA